MRRSAGRASSRSHSTPKWEIDVHQSRDIGPIFLDPSAALLRENERQRGGKTDLETQSVMAAEGWEPVAVTPLVYDGETRSLLFTFKCPVSAWGSVCGRYCQCLSRLQGQLSPCKVANPRTQLML